MPTVWKNVFSYFETCQRKGQRDPSSLVSKAQYNFRATVKLNIVTNKMILSWDKTILFQIATSSRKLHLFSTSLPGGSRNMRMTLRCSNVLHSSDISIQQIAFRWGWQDVHNITHMAEISTEQPLHHQVGKLCGIQSRFGDKTESWD